MWTAEEQTRGEPRQPQSIGHVPTPSRGEPVPDVMLVMTKTVSRQPGRTGRSAAGYRGSMLRRRGCAPASTVYNV